jgi:hypothetical protein
MHFGFPVTPHIWLSNIDELKVGCHHLTICMADNQSTETHEVIEGQWNARGLYSIVLRMLPQKLSRSLSDGA